MGGCRHAGGVTSRVVIGRAGEQARLGAAFLSACAGTPVTVLVAGEAGIGKTRLVGESRATWGRRRSCSPGGALTSGVPYLPVADALRSLLRGGWRPGEVDGSWSRLGVLVPELAGGAERLVGAAAGSPERLQVAFLRLMETLVEERPVIVLVEDLHWSDESTRNLLMYTMRAARDFPLLVVGTYRTDDLTRRHPLRPFLAEATRLRRPKSSSWRASTPPASRSS